MYKVQPLYSAKLVPHSPVRSGLTQLGTLCSQESSNPIHKCKGNALKRDGRRLQAYSATAAVKHGKKGDRVARCGGNLTGEPHGRGLKGQDAWECGQDMEFDQQLQRLLAKEGCINAVTWCGRSSVQLNTAQHSTAQHLSLITI